MAWRASLVTHTDLDGVASAAIASIMLGVKPGEDARVVFTEPYRLHKTLRSIVESVSPDERIVISDLGPNADTIGVIANMLGEAVRRGARVYWFDHHQWSAEWVAKLREAGVNVNVDNSTCAAGVVAKYGRELFGFNDEARLRYIRELVAATCAADIWLWDHPAAPKLYRIVDWKRGRAGDKWRRRLLEKIIAASSLDDILSDEEVRGALMDYVNRELRQYSVAVRKVVVMDVEGSWGKCRVVVALKKSGPPSRSFLARTLMARYGADIVVVIHSRGLSFRSERCDVSILAKRLGGGGHRKAAGAKLKMNPLYALLAKLVPSLRLRKAAAVVRKVVEEVGCKPLEPKAGGVD